MASALLETPVLPKTEHLPVVESLDDSPSAGWGRRLIAGVAGVMTPFTISLVGEMPVGEVVLMAAAGWALLCVLVQRELVVRQWRQPWFLAAMIAQGVGLLAYVVSDLYRGSAPADFVRGWARMGFLAIDLVAVGYLLDRDWKVLWWLVGGVQLGHLLAGLVYGPLFGDWWKFCLAEPVTYLTLALGAWLGRGVVTALAVGLGLLHFALDFRSMGGLCFLVAGGLSLQMLPQYSRAWVLPIVAALALGGIVVVYQGQSSADRRASRSDVSRQAMLQAAWEGFAESPLVGQGSWFSRSNVYDNFLLIQDEAAKEIEMGGFVGPNEETENVSLHSQLLVALAEGGIFGAAFFWIYGVALVAAMGRLVIGGSWNRTSGVAIFLGLLALWHLFMSPFSGAHRVYIALAFGLALVTLHKNSDTAAEVAS